MGENFVNFIGRFHPLIVHLPIGFLIMSGLLQLYTVRNSKKAANMDAAIAFTLFWGTIASIGAVVIGWLLSLDGGYDKEMLFWHKWLGVLVTFLSFFGWILKKNLIRLPKEIFYTTLVSIFILISIAGHLGGNLTHGETYLTQNAPNFIKYIAGVETEEKKDDLNAMHQDSIRVYSHLIQPILDSKCISCHNPTKKEGGLLLTSHKELFAGGDNGSIIDIKSPLESELLNRVTLPKEHKKFMPPKGEVLTFGEIQLLEWWMKSGADSISKFSTVPDLDKKIIWTLMRDYDLDYNPKPYHEKVKVEKLTAEILDELRIHNFDVDFMGEHSNMISLTFKGKLISDDQISKLLLATEQITWLKLSNCKMNDAQLRVVSSLRNLTRLNVHSNKITDKGVKHLSTLEHLISLNLYNNQISNLSLNDLTMLKSLRRLYVWKTDITTSEIEKLANNQSRLEIISQIN